MRAFLSIKFSGDDSNRQEVEEVISAIEGAGIEVFCFRRDAEKWGDVMFRAEEMMELTFNEINKSDFLVADVSDWPIGVGVEAGYAHAKGVLVICICRMSKKLANNVAGFAKSVIRYSDGQHLKRQITPILTQQVPAMKAQADI